MSITDGTLKDKTRLSLKIDNQLMNVLFVQCVSTVFEILQEFNFFFLHHSVKGRACEYDLTSTMMERNIKKGSQMNDSAGFRLRINTLARKCFKMHSGRYGCFQKAMLHRYLGGFHQTRQEHLQLICCFSPNQKNKKKTKKTKKEKKP